MNEPRFTNIRLRYWTLEGQKRTSRDICNSPGSSVLCDRAKFQIIQNLKHEGKLTNEQNI